MTAITVRARVRRDGALAIPKIARDKLGLHEGDQVDITVNAPDVPSTISESDPLLGLIGIGKGGPKDGAEDHDAKLYRQQA